MNAGPEAVITGDASDKEDSLASQQKKREIEALFRTPISIHGKVVDENGDSISGASVQIRITDSPSPSVTSSQHTANTDVNGKFTFGGVRGIAFSAAASKAGYYKTSRAKAQRNMIAPARDDAPLSSDDKPLVLVMRKRGEADALITVRSGQIEVPPTGEPIRVDLGSGATGEGDLELSSWIGDPSQRRYDWRYQLRIRSGGFVEREGEFSFEAPAQGYRDVTDVDMSASKENWKDRTERNYFARLSDGRYGRFSIRLYTGPRNFVVIESFVNPTPGRRNLEYDPEKRVSVSKR
ncbi:MAG: carboxypeptidase-like regulatory domain-containing protein [Chthoniobacterales bacterium]